MTCELPCRARPLAPERQIDSHWDEPAFRRRDIAANSFCRAIGSAAILASRSSRENGARSRKGHGPNRHEGFLHPLLHALHALEVVYPEGIVDFGQRTMAKAMPSVRSNFQRPRSVYPRGGELLPLHRNAKRRPAALPAHKRRR